MYTKVLSSAKKTGGKLLPFLDKVKDYALPIIIILVLYYFFKSQIASLFTTVKNQIGAVGSGLTDNQAKLRANALLLAMNKFGTDFESIKTNLTGLTQADYQKVSNEFGIKPYISVTGTLGNGLVGQDMNLTEWLGEELLPDELMQIRNLLPFLA